MPGLAVEPAPRSMAQPLHRERRLTPGARKCMLILGQSVTVQLMPAAALAVGSANFLNSDSYSCTELPDIFNSVQE